MHITVLKGYGICKRGVGFKKTTDAEQICWSHLACCAILIQSLVTSIAPAALLVLQFLNKLTKSLKTFFYKLKEYKTLNYKNVKF